MAKFILFDLDGTLIDGVDDLLFAMNETLAAQDLAPLARPELASDGWIIGLASNKPTAPCKRILERLGVFDLFAVIVGGDATHVKKPDGAHLAFALDQAGYDRARGDIAIMVGDHANDVNAARNFGIPAIAVAFEVDDTRAKNLAADGVVTAFENLPDAIGKIVKQAA